MNRELPATPTELAGYWELRARAARAIPPAGFNRAADREFVDRQIVIYERTAAALRLLKEGE